MIEDVRNHIRTCCRCTRFKQIPEREKLKLIHSTYPLQLIHINFLTIGNEGTEKATNIMVVIDHFTRYTQVYTPKQTAPVVARMLWDQFLVHYGWLTKISTGQGKLFENQLVRELCSLAQVQKLHTTPYRPQTNGSCEHFNYTLMSMLGTLPVHAKKNWPKWVSTLNSHVQCYNVLFHRVFPILLNVQENTHSANRCGVWCGTARYITCQLTELCRKAQGLVKMDI